MIGYTVSVLTVLVALWLRFGLGGLRIPRKGAIWFILAGVFNGTSLLALYGALKTGNVVIVAPISATFPLFTLLFSLLFFRSERITRRIVGGTILVVAGAALVIR